MRISWKEISAITLLPLAAAAMLAIAGCTSVPQTANAAATRKIKVGFFIDRGSTGSGNMRLARLLYYMPEVEFEFLLGKDLRDGRLMKDKFDLFVIPGGDSGLQYTSMQEEGAEAVRRFVAAGGSYFGVCAGFHCALNKPRRIGLLPFTHLNNSYGLKAPLVFELSERGSKVLDIPKGRYTVTYSQAPIATSAKQPGSGWGEVLGVYLNSVSSPSRPNLNFVGTPSIIHGQYGKGKVIATSFHPEYLASTYPIAYGCIYAVTGLRSKPAFPAKSPRPIRIAFYCDAMCKEKAIAFFEFDRQPDFDVQTATLGDGVLEHVDALVLSKSRIESIRKYLTNEKNANFIREFTERGGKVYLDSVFAEIAPKWNNVVVVPAGKSMVEAVRADFPALASCGRK